MVLTSVGLTLLVNVVVFYVLRTTLLTRWQRGHNKRFEHLSDAQVRVRDIWKSLPIAVVTTAVGMAVTLLLTGSILPISTLGVLSATAFALVFGWTLIGLTELLIWHPIKMMVYAARHRRPHHHS